MRKRISERRELHRRERSPDRPLMSSFQESTTEVAPGLFLYQHNDEREIFYWSDGKEELCFDVTTIRRRIFAGEIKYMLVDLPLDETVVQFLIDNRGVELWRVDQLAPEDLAEPIIGLLARTPAGDYQPITVDGNHRIARRALDGVPYVQAYLVAPPDWRTHAAPKGREHELYERWPATSRRT